ncbi:hypothetical protein O181_033848 [Austropuccinia psidii MF-1]|uniref:Uncharacterized protein n=1 Tax=Austropuccinia psidii MF-1 TaxID=1389203 RepID=A0A9Q3D2A6_9BASI|nr:hypothetical protein [Austropuccinia psidii MF-1]
MDGPINIKVTLSANTSRSCALQAETMYFVTVKNVKSPGPNTYTGYYVPLQLLALVLPKEFHHMLTDKVSTHGLGVVINKMETKPSTPDPNNITLNINICHTD